MTFDVGRRWLTGAWQLRVIDRRLVPVRDADFREYCEACSKRATDSCARCQRAFCDTHKPESGDRCLQCETEYYEKPGRLTRTADQAEMVGLLGGVSGGSLGLALIAGGFAATGIGIVALSAALIAWPFVRLVGKRRERGKFLAEGSERKLLGDGGDEVVTADTSSTTDDR